MADREIPVEQAGRILELADPKTLARNAARRDPLGTFLEKVMAAADPDEEFQAVVKTLFTGYRQVERRAHIEMLRLALGIERPVLKKYLRAAGIVNEMD